MQSFRVVARVIYLTCIANRADTTGPSRDAGPLAERALGSPEPPDSGRSTLMAGDCWALTRDGLRGMPRVPVRDNVDHPHDAEEKHV